MSNWLMRQYVLVKLPATSRKYLLFCCNGTFFLNTRYIYGSLHISWIPNYYSFLTFPYRDVKILPFRGPMSNTFLLLVPDLAIC